MRVLAELQQDWEQKEAEMAASIKSLEESLQAERERRRKPGSSIHTTAHTQASTHASTHANIHHHPSVPSHTVHTSHRSHSMHGGDNNHGHTHGRHSQSHPGKHGAAHGHAHTHEDALQTAAVSGEHQNEQQDQMHTQESEQEKTFVTKAVDGAGGEAGTHIDGQPVEGEVGEDTDELYEYVDHQDQAAEAIYGDEANNHNSNNNIEAGTDNATAGNDNESHFSVPSFQVDAPAPIVHAPIPHTSRVTHIHLVSPTMSTHGIHGNHGDGDRELADVSVLSLSSANNSTVPHGPKQHVVVKKPRVPPTGASSLAFNKWMKQLFGNMVRTIKAMHASHSSPSHEIQHHTAAAIHIPNATVPSAPSCGCTYRKRLDAATNLLFLLCSARNEVLKQVAEADTNTSNMGHDPNATATGANSNHCSFSSSGCKQVVCCLDALMVSLAFVLSPQDSSDDTAPSSSVEDGQLLDSIFTNIDKEFATHTGSLDYLLLWELQNQTNWRRARDRLAGRGDNHQVDTNSSDRHHHEGNDDKEHTDGPLAMSCGCRCDCPVIHHNAPIHPSSPANAKRYMNRSTTPRAEMTESAHAYLESDLQLGEEERPQSPFMMPALTVTPRSAPTPSPRLSRISGLVDHRPLSSGSPLVASPRSQQHARNDGSNEGVGIDTVRLVGNPSTPSSAVRKTRKSGITVNTGPDTAAAATYSMIDGANVVALPNFSVGAAPHATNKMDADNTSASDDRTAGATRKERPSQKLSFVVFDLNTKQSQSDSAPQASSSQVVDSVLGNTSSLTPVPPSAAEMPSSRPSSTRNSIVTMKEKQGGLSTPTQGQRPSRVNTSASSTEDSSLLSVNGVGSPSPRNNGSFFGRPNSASFYADRSKKSAIEQRKSGLVKTAGQLSNDNATTATAESTQQLDAPVIVTAAPCVNAVDKASNAPTVAYEAGSSLDQHLFPHPDTYRQYINNVVSSSIQTQNMDDAINTLGVNILNNNIVQAGQEVGVVDNATQASMMVTGSPAKTDGARQKVTGALMHM
jgi:hypothetical protein